MREMSFTKLKDISYNLCKALYIPLWMNHSRTLNNRINVLHKRALSLVYNDFSSSFSELLEKDKSVTIHHRNLQTLAYEIFKVKNNMAPEILTEIFPQKENNYSLRNRATLQGRSIKTVMYGSEAIQFGAKDMEHFTNGIKKIVSPTLFEKKIREWAPKNCACSLCKTCVQNIGFL